MEGGEGGRNKEGGTYLAKIHHLLERAVDVFDEVRWEGDDNFGEEGELLEYPLFYDVSICCFSFVYLTVYGVQIGVEIDDTM